MKKLKCSTLLAPALIAVVAGSASAQTSDLDQLKATVQQLQRTIQEQNARIAELERAKGITPPATAATPAVPAVPADKDKSLAQITTEAPPAGQATPVPYRQTLKDEQEAAPRAGDLIMDPKYQGYMHVPNTPVIIRFNAKPRVDFTYDLQNAGNDDRFVTAHIPVDGDPFKGGDGIFNINAKGSQLRLDVRAPEFRGSPRFYYENDFFGSGGGEFPYRIRHLYGQIYNIIVGQTYSVFEDPDVWPDTVDYEGPNSAIFVRRPLARYQLPLSREWQLNFGLEQPSAEVDTSIDPDARSVNHAPDGGMNVRWERAKVGHVQLAGMARDIGVRGPIVGDQSVLGWGLNLSSSMNVFGKDSVQGQVTYGEGIFRFSNDDFFNNDAAFDSSGDMEALPYLGVMFGYTHHWTDNWRSTVSYGYVNLDNAASQAPDAYHETHYASANVIYKLTRRLSIGLEGLYGHKEVKSGADGDVWRIQAGLVYWLWE
jgi:hypothetical protein